MSMISKENEETTIDLLEVLKTLWRKAWLILICGGLAAAAAFCITRFAIKPTYRTQVTMYVNNRVEEGKSLSQSDLNAAAKLVDTYSAIIRSDTVMGVVATRIGSNLELDQIKKRVSAQAINNTEVFNVYVVDTEPVRAADIANTIAEHGAVMAIGAGLVLAGILASTMSTADSQLLAAASSVSQDIMQGTMRANSDKKAMSKSRSMFAARITVVVIAVFAVIIARDPGSYVFKIVAFSWAGFGASFGPLVLASLFWKRTTFEGALAGMVAGGVSIFVWKFLVAPMGGVWGIYELLPAFLISLVVLVGVSLMTPADEEVMKEFEEMERSL